MDLKELDKFLKICRKQGVTEITYEGTSVKLGDLPMERRDQEESTDEIPTDALTPDELMFYHIEGGK